MDVCSSFQLLFCKWQFLKYILKDYVLIICHFLCLVVVHFSGLGTDLWSMTADIFEDAYAEEQ